MDDVVIPEPISAVKDFLLKPQKLLIGDKRVDTVSGKTFEVFDPFSNLLLTHVQKWGKEDIDRAVKAGTVWLNCHNIFDAAAPFSGYKRIGYGRVMGIHSLENYTQLKNVIIQLHN